MISSRRPKPDRTYVFLSSRMNFDSVTSITGHGIFDQQKRGADLARLFGHGDMRFHQSQ